MPTSRICTRLAACKAAKRTAFVAFVTAGFPQKAVTTDALLALQRGGADVIEVGIPFSDPMADGTTIQKASKVALDNGTTVQDCFDAVQAARAQGLHVPVVLMGYYNTLLCRGLEKTCQLSVAAGVDGYIVVDLPPEEAGTFKTVCDAHELSIIPIVAPTSTADRLAKLAACASSFVYCVSLTGVTGARTVALAAELKDIIEATHTATGGLPVCVGFGLQSREQVEQVAAMGADGAVVGSALVTALEKGGIEAMEKLCSQLSGGVFTCPDTESVKALPNSADMPTGADWNFGDFGGRYIPETLMAAHEELDRAYREAKADPAFAKEIERLRAEFVGGPTPLYHAKRLTEKFGGAQIWFKREELAHTGAHKINNALGQALLCKRLGKKRVIAETGAGQHGVASATACALMGLECVVYMGAVDVERQSLNVFRMKLLGAEVIPVSTGTRTLKDAINEAMRDWVTNIRDTHYIVGSAIGPHPFPDIVRDFQSIISTEARQQMLNDSSKGFSNGPGRLPDAVVCCVGGGSNAIGMFHGFIQDEGVKLIGVEAGGEVGPSSGKHCATLSAGTVGVLHGNRTFLLQDGDGQITETHSISAGLDYPGVGPQHAHLKASGRADYVWATDVEALDAMQDCARCEGIIPALEPSHALAYVFKMAKTMDKEQIILLNLCGRGDKDMHTVAKARGVKLEFE